jgi:hypothetical protein
MGAVQRCVCVLLAAISLGTANPQSDRKAEQNQAEQIERGSARIANAIGQLRQDKDSGCEDRQDERGSDLCAQWKAADAARDAADYTFIAVLLSFIGTFLVAVTLLITVRTSRRELRAYVGLMDYSLTPMDLVNAATGKVSIGIQNYGQTPAKAVTTVISYGFVDWDGEMSKPGEWSYVGKKLPIDIAPGAPAGRTVSFREHGLAHVVELPTGESGLCVEVALSYLDIFGDHHAQTVWLWSRGATYNAGHLIVMEQSREATIHWWEFWRKVRESQPAEQEGQEDA